MNTLTTEQKLIIIKSWTHRFFIRQDSDKKYYGKIRFGEHNAIRHNVKACRSYKSAINTAYDIVSHMIWCMVGDSNKCDGCNGCNIINA